VDPEAAVPWVEEVAAAVAVADRSRTLEKTQAPTLESMREWMPESMRARTAELRTLARTPELMPVPTQE
jgi:uncharacterized protein (DUF2267 family)